MSGIPLVLDKMLLQEGIRQYLNVNLSRNHHWILAGPTGSGKSYLSLILIGKISKFVTNSKVYILDFKGSGELKYLKSVPNARYFSYLDCGVGLQQVNELFESRLRGSEDRTPVVLFWDEYNSYINYLSIQDKKAAEAQKMVLSNILFLSRELNLFCILSVQRPDSLLFNNGAREQCTGTIGLGALSPEAIKMLFGEYDTSQIMPCGMGEGYLAMQGSPNIHSIVVPTVHNMDKLKTTIANAVTR